MPQMTGKQLGKIFRERQGKGEFSHQSEIMLLTGDERLIDDSEAQEIFDYICCKPIS